MNAPRFATPGSHGEHARAVRSQPRLRQRGGLSLLDLVITVLIVGIMAAVGVPRFIDTLHRYRAKSAAERVAVDLELARKDAMSCSAGRTTQFSVPAASSYTVFGLSDPNRSTADYIVDLSLAPYNSAIVSVDFGGDASLIFNGYGVPDSGGTVVVSSGGRQVVVSVDPETGKATIP